MGPVHRTPGHPATQKPFSLALKVIRSGAGKGNYGNHSGLHLTGATTACNIAIHTDPRVPVKDRTVKESLYSAKHKEWLLIRYEKVSQSNGSHFYHRDHFYHKQGCICAPDSLHFSGSQRKDIQSEMKIQFLCKMRKEVLCAIPTITQVKSGRAEF